MTIKKLQRAIEKAKKQLIQKAKEGGLYENFGENEARELNDKFIDSSSYNKEMNEKRLLVSNFENWAMNFDLNDLKKN